MKWLEDQTEANLALMRQVLNLSETACKALANRGVRSKNAATIYLNPKPQYLGNFMTCEGADECVLAVVKAINEKTPVVVYGDYDVDGVMGTVILVKALRALGADTSYYIPAREEEGYGLNIAAVDRIYEQGARLIIAVDNGIAAHAEIEHANKLGVEVIVIDHHEPQFIEAEDGSRTDIIPPARAVIDPKRRDCPYPFKLMCAGALAYRFAEIMHLHMGIPFALREELMIFGAIATVCDIVSLIGDNRIIVANGIELINSRSNTNKGLNALIRLRNYADKRIGCFEIGFILGPCINATGRLTHAKMSVELFLTDNEMEAEIYAAKLIELNDERKAMTQTAVEQTLQILEKSKNSGDMVQVILAENVHESIIGIVAGRVREVLSRPVIMLTKSGEFIKGSGRSIPAYDMFEGLLAHKELFERFGGHSMAAGLTILPERVDELREKLNETCKLTESDCETILHYDAELSPEQITYELAAELARFSPFGKDNPEPTFATYGAIVTEAAVIGATKTTLRLTIENPSGSPLKAIAFGKAERFCADIVETLGADAAQTLKSGILRKKFSINVLYNLNINRYNGNVSVDLKLLDWKFN